VAVKSIRLNFWKCPRIICWKAVNSFLVAVVGAFLFFPYKKSSNDFMTKELYLLPQYFPPAYWIMFLTMILVVFSCLADFLFHLVHNGYQFKRKAVLPCWDSRLGKIHFKNSAYTFCLLDACQVVSLSNTRHLSFFVYTLGYAPRLRTSALHCYSCHVSTCLANRLGHLGTN
jgi:hypothetical protein